MKIGIFDSGLGGLVITQSFIKEMPEYDYVYYGDTKNLPYGDKSGWSILQYTIEAIKFLIAQDCAIIVIACNTATSIALRFIQQQFIPVHAPNIKVLGVVIPTVEVACEQDAQRIGVIATQATVRSGIYSFELHKLKPELEVQEIAAPDLVPLIEKNEFEKAEEACKEYAKSFDKIDSLILGCTHYPLLKEYFQKALPGTKIVSQDEFMGLKLEDYLRRHDEIKSKLSTRPGRNFWVSELSNEYQKTAKRLFTNIEIKEAV